LSALSGFSPSAFALPWLAIAKLAGLASRTRAIAVAIAFFMVSLLAPVTARQLNQLPKFPAWH
jgi:hypothetical protein